MFTIQAYSKNLLMLYLLATGYAGSPRKIAYKYYPTSRSYALYWEQPSAKDGHWVRKYVLEEWKESEAIWVQRLNITTLHVTIKSIQSTTKYRVCAANEIGYKETSCSKSVELRRSIIIMLFYWIFCSLVSFDFFDSWKYYLKITRIFSTFI